MPRRPIAARRIPPPDQAPVVSLGSGPVVAPVIRSVVQAAIVDAGIRLATVLPNPDLRIDDGDQALIRRTPAPAVAPPDHV